MDREVSRDWQRSYLQWQGQRQGQRASTAGPKFVPYAAKHSLLHHASGCTPNGEMTLDLEVLTSLASVAWSTSLCSSGGRPISTSATDSDSAPLQPCSPHDVSRLAIPSTSAAEACLLLLLDRFYDLVLRRVLKEQSFWNILSLRRCKSWSESLDDLTYAYAPRWSTCWRTNL